MSKALDGVVELLDLEQIEVNIFRGRSPGGSGGSASSAARWPGRRSWQRAARCPRTGRCTRCSGARGLARGEVYTEDGELVVSVVQEGLVRRRS